MSLLGEVLQGAFEAQVLRDDVQEAEAGEQIVTRPLVKARIWGTRGRLGLFYVVERAREAPASVSRRREAEGSPDPRLALGSCADDADVG